MELDENNNKIVNVVDLFELLYIESMGYFEIFDLFLKYFGYKLVWLLVRVKFVRNSKINNGKNIELNLILWWFEWVEVFFICLKLVFEFFCGLKYDYNG